MKRFSKGVGPILLLLAGAVLGRAEDKINLRFTVWEGDENLKIIRNSVEKFEAAHPNIHVKIERVDQGAYMEKLLAQFAAGQAPDVSAFEPKMFRKLASRGALAPLDPFLAKDPSINIKEWYEPIVRVSKWKNQLYILPRDIAPMGLIYYNKKLFDEAGIPYPDGSWTWDYHERPELKEKDFLWVLHHLTKFDDKGKVTQWALSPGWGRLLADTLAFCAHGQFFDDPTDFTKVTYNDPNVVQAFQFAQDLSYKYKYVPSALELSSVLQTNSILLFTQGKVAMVQSGIWETPNLRKFLKPGTPGWFEWDIAPFPAFRDGHLLVPTGGTGYGLFATSKHPQEAWELLKWMGGPPGMADLAASGLAQPANRRIALQEPWIPGPHTPAALAYPHNRIITDQLAPITSPYPTAEYFIEIDRVTGAPLDLIWNGSKDAKTALDEATALGQQRLDQILTDEKNPPLNWPAAIGLGALLLFAILGYAFMGQKGKLKTVSQRREAKSAAWFLMPWAIGTLGFVLGPMILSLIMSFSDWDIVAQAKYRGLGNYTEAFSRDPLFWKALTVTGIYTLFAVPLGLIFALALALLLNVKVKGIPLFRAGFYMPSLASLVASSLIWRKVFQPEGGLLNSLIYGPDGHGNFLGLATLLAPLAGKSAQVNWLGTEQTALPAIIMMSVWGVGGGMIILLAGLQGIPEHYYEAATLDGAGWTKQFRAITLPLLTPSLFFSLVTGMIGSLQIFTQALVVTNGGPNNATLFYVLHIYRQAFDNLRMGYGSALAWILFLIILVLTLIQFRASRWVYYEGEVKS